MAYDNTAGKACLLITITKKARKNKMLLLQRKINSELVKELSLCKLQLERDNEELQ